MSVDLSPALALHIHATGGVALAQYLEQLGSWGVRGIEWVLPAHWNSGQLAPLDAVLAQLARQQMIVHLRLEAPLADDWTYTGMAWQALYRTAAQIAEQQQQPVQCVLTPAGGAHADATAYRTTTITGVRRLIAHAGAVLRPQLRLVRASSSALGWQERGRRWWHHRREAHGYIASPPGTVHSGLGGPVLATHTPERATIDAVIAPPAMPFSAGQDRATLLHTVQATDGAAGLCWDLGADWYNGVWLGRTPWSTLPDADFLAAVEHVLVCDALPGGHTQMPLIPGNVPYTTQGRALVGQRPIAATLDIAYGELALRLGPRQATLQQSLAILKRALRLVD